MDWTVGELSRRHPWRAAMAERPACVARRTARLEPRPVAYVRVRIAAGRRRISGRAVDDPAGQR
eukprot:1378194-Lingulodinium_polyedra.AAC.1